MPDQNRSNDGCSSRSRTPSALALLVRRWVPSPSHASWNPVSTDPSMMWMAWPSPSQRCRQYRVPVVASYHEPWFPAPPWATANLVPSAFTSTSSAGPWRSCHVTGTSAPVPSIFASH